MWKLQCASAQQSWVPEQPHVMAKLTLTVLVQPRDGVYFAQSLEHHFTATGGSREDAIDALCEVLRGQALLDREAGRAPLTWVGAAPREFREFARRVTTQLPARDVDLFPSEAADESPSRHLVLSPVG